jgi:hypothetical protein
MFKKTINKIILVIAFLVVAISGYYITFRNTPDSKGSSETRVKATVYKSPTCSCCLGHAGYLKGEGFEVDNVVVDDIESIKDEYDIPYNMRSCHTTIIGDYFIEGHMPIEAVNKLLTEKPDIDGISLPDMPAGSPGMPGIKREEFIIYSLTDGNSEEFMRL